MVCATIGVILSSNGMAMEVATQQIEFFGMPPGSFHPTPPGRFEGGVGVYLHGEAEDAVGFDIPCTNVDLFDVELGVHPVLLDGQEGYTLFLWKNPIMPTLLRGLVVKDSDAEGYAHAKARFEKQSHGL